MSSFTLEQLAESDDERSQELATLASIFPDELRILSASSAIAVIPISPLAPLDATLSTSSATARLHHLPPLHLKIDLPELYPADAPPALELSTTPPWLPAEKLEELEQECLQLWEEYGRGQVLYSIIDHIQQCVERGFDLKAVPVSDDDMWKTLTTFNHASKKELFERSTFDCSFCLEPRKGRVCHAIRSCGHVFCKNCLVDYFATLITEGDVSSVRCVNGACPRQAHWTLHLLMAVGS